MESFVARLIELGPSGAVLLALAGLVCGLFGWRIVRYLAVVDAVVAAVCIGVLMRTDADEATFAGLPLARFSLVIVLGLPWLAWRFPRWAVGIMGGTIACLVVLALLTEFDLPLSVCLLLGFLAGGLALGLHLTLYRQTAVVVTGLQGGWLCTAAIVAASADPRSFGWLLFSAIDENLCLFPLIAMVFSFMLIALQLTDLEQSANPCANS
jgi:hypothetical protein